MRLSYKYWKTKKHEYFFYINWVAHDGFGRPRLKINKETYPDIFHVFDFMCYKMHIYLVKAPFKSLKKNAGSSE